MSRTFRLRHPYRRRHRSLLNNIYAGYLNNGVKVVDSSCRFNRQEFRYIESSIISMITGMDNNTSEDGVILCPTRDAYKYGLSHRCMDIHGFGSIPYTAYIAWSIHDTIVGIIKRSTMCLGDITNMDRNVYGDDSFIKSKISKKRKRKLEVKLAMLSGYYDEL